MNSQRRMLNAVPAIPANSIEPSVAENLTTEELAEREGLLPKGGLRPANNNNEPRRTRKHRN